MTELSLFSGYGGFTLGLKLAIPNIRTIGYVEWGKYPQQIIATRIKEGFLDEAPIFGDIRAFNCEGYAERYRGLVDILTAGFPCQPFSVAGKQKGEADERNMWPATLESICLVRPRIVLLENVPALLSNEYIRQIYGDLAKEGYCIPWDCISAAECGANHKRKRLWIVAYSRHGGWRNKRSVEKGGKEKTKRTLNPHEIARSSSEPVLLADSDSMWESQSQRGEQNQRGRAGDSSEVCHPTEQGLQNGRSPSVGQPTGAEPEPKRPDCEISHANGSRCNEQCGAKPSAKEYPTTECGGWWETEPPLGRVVDGCPGRVGQLKALGNGIVPIVVAEFLRRTNESE